MISSEERSLRDAVSPFLCEELFICDLDPKLAKKIYLIADKQIFLKDYAWDHCNFYRETDHAYFEACGQPIRKTIPAFTMADMINILPPFMLIKNNDVDYEASLDTYYTEIDVQKDRRAPDVLARLAIDMLKKKFLIPAAVNHMLS